MLTCNGLYTALNACKLRDALLLAIRSIERLCLCVMHAHTALTPG